MGSKFVYIKRDEYYYGISSSHICSFYSTRKNNEVTKNVFFLSEYIQAWNQWKLPDAKLSCMGWITQHWHFPIPNDYYCNLGVHKFPLNPVGNTLILSSYLHVASFGKLTAPEEEEIIWIKWFICGIMESQYNWFNVNFP